MDVTLRALNRFGLGARRGERQRISDARGWLKAQLDGGAPAIRSSEGASPSAIGDALRALRAAGSKRRAAAPRGASSSGRSGGGEARTALQARVSSDRPFVERLVAFWSNHLCVSAGSKVLVAPLAGSYERDVIRPHVLGRFEDMVLASARHPAMLAYLDNFQSIGPSSPGARVGQRNNGARRGLNENYARELLELHTLGVNGGYTQGDVQELARILTGWTIDGIGGPGARPPQGSQPRGGVVRRVRVEPSGPIGFAFREMLHEPGTKTVLNERYNEDGVAEGERAIHALCRHPSTARFVATKLATHFVSDDPPAATVDRLARAFRSSDGDLKAVARALIDEPEAWREDTRKFRTPQEWFVAVMRAFGASDVSPNAPPSCCDNFASRSGRRHHPRASVTRCRSGRTRTPSSIAGSWRARSSRLPSVTAIDPRSLLDVIDVPAGNPLHDVDRGHLDSRARTRGARDCRPGIPVEVTMNRRTFVRNMCYGGIATLHCHVSASRRSRQGGPLVFVLLRGGFDGLAAVVPVRRSRVPRCARCVRLQRVGAHPTRRHVRAGAGPVAAARVLGQRRARRACTRWRFHIGRGAISMVRRSWKPGSITRSGRRTGG